MLSRILRCRQITNRLLNTSSTVLGDASKKNKCDKIGKIVKCQPCKPEKKPPVDKCKTKADEEKVFCLIENFQLKGNKT